MIKENKSIRVILANNRMSRVISLNQINKTNKYNVNM
jgi:hypothetical protein